MDFGTRRIGVAISDGLMITAQGQDSIIRTDLARDLDEIKKIIKENNVSEIVVGLPISMNGSYSAKTKEVVEFIDNLSKAVDIPIETWDERLTSLQAERTLLEADVSRHKRKMLSDKLAAQIMLQTYMDFRKKG